MDFTLYNDTSVTVEVGEPEAKTVSDLISEMNRAVLAHNVFFVYDGSDFSFNDKNERKTGTMVGLSPFMSRTFGIAYPKWLYGVMKLKSYENINFGLDSEFILIRCNVIESQFYLGKLMNILKMIQVQSPGEKNLIHVYNFYDPDTQKKFFSVVSFESF